MKVVVLAGGMGTGLAEETAVRPKPMEEIGDRPILWHLMKHHAHHGHKDFLVCLGYRGEMIKEYFLHYHQLANDLTLSLRDGQVTTHGRRSEDWVVTLVDTGFDTQTGGRLRRVRNYVNGSSFLLTYADDLSDMDLSLMVAFHRQHGRLATITAVRQPARFGGLVLDGDRVAGLGEKPAGQEGWSGAGHFVFQPEVFNYLEGDATILEREPLQRLATEGELMACRHEGFWHRANTLRDVKTLNEMWDGGQAPWRVWK